MKSAQKGTKDKGQSQSQNRKPETTARAKKGDDRNRESVPRPDRSDKANINSDPGAEAWRCWHGHLRGAGRGLERGSSRFPISRLDIISIQTHASTSGSRHGESHEHGAGAGEGAGVHLGPVWA